jgi:hypothetical protein
MPFVVTVSAWLAVFWLVVWCAAAWMVSAADSMDAAVAAVDSMDAAVAAVDSAAVVRSSLPASLLASFAVQPSARLLAA